MLLIIHESIGVFDSLLHAGLIGATGNASVAAVPPRPPYKLWDAPRCVQYCKFMGVTTALSRYLGEETGMELVWNAVTSCLKNHFSVAKLSPWVSHNAVPPIPFKVEPINIMGLLTTVLKLAVNLNLHRADNHQNIRANELTMSDLMRNTLCPIIISLHYRTNMSKLKYRFEGEFSAGRAFEDILRFGGYELSDTNHFDKFYLERFNCFF